jgi:hypothetical protein
LRVSAKWLGVRYCSLQLFKMPMLHVQACWCLMALSCLDNVAAGGAAALAVYEFLLSVSVEISHRQIASC